MLRTRLTDRFALEHPVILAPMAFAAGGALAGAVSRAGGLGLIGGGYGDPDWLRSELERAGDARVGCGFITWSLAQAPALLDLVLGHRPAALLLSFGDPRPFAKRIHDAGVPLLCQVQDREMARAALAAGAAVLVAQGTAAGGHGATRSTITLVPEIVDLCAKEHPDTLVVAAGGIADGRGLAAALMLGADGVLMGSRFWATREAAVPAGFHAAAIAAGADDTLRTRVVDIVRAKAWPAPFTARVLRNRFVARWHGQEEGLRAKAHEELPGYTRAWNQGDAEGTGVFVGEATSFIGSVPAAGTLLRSIVEDACGHLAAGAARVR